MRSTLPTVCRSSGNARNLTSPTFGYKSVFTIRSRLQQVKSVLADGGYTGEPFALGVRQTLGEQVTVQIAKRSELHSFRVMPKRWVVERSFAWLEKNRRLSKNHERWLNTSLQFVHLAFLALLLRRL